MAQIEQSDKGGKKKKGAQKKIPIHVDFTPMVDMNMLLITFFMLCTTMIKSQTLAISLPSNDKDIKQEQKNQAKESEALTLILDAERDDDGHPLKLSHGTTIYYYQGKPPVINDDGTLDWTPSLSERLEQKSFDPTDEEKGIRSILQERNKAVIEKVNEQKQRWRDKEITKEQFDSISKTIRNDSNLSRPVVVIKATPDASWESVISALDEMSINSISRYQIENVNILDSMMITDARAKEGKKTLRRSN